MTRRPFRLIAALLALTIARADDKPEPILRGVDPGQFDLVGLEPGSIAIEGGEIRLTGKPLGYFATRREYRDFRLTFEYSHDRPEGLKSDADFRGNGGLLLHVSGPSKVWPRSIQVQLAQADPGALLALDDPGFRSRSVPAAQMAAVRPVGEWNRVEVTCRAGSVACVLNGVEVARGEGANPDRGTIGWQSEGSPIRFRNPEIMPLP